MSDEDDNSNDSLINVNWSGLEKRILKLVPKGLIIGLIILFFIILLFYNTLRRVDFNKNPTDLEFILGIAPVLMILIVMILISFEFLKQAKKIIAED